MISFFTSKFHIELELVSRRYFLSLTLLFANAHFRESKLFEKSSSTNLTLKQYSRKTQYMKSCLFVVDVQNGFISKKTAYVKEKIKSLLEQNLFDYVVFTKFLNTLDSPYVHYLRWNRLLSEEDQKLVDTIEPFAKTVFCKTTYTSINAETLDFIKKNRIEVVFVAGIDTDCCVLKTAVDLFEHNIRPYVLERYSASNGGKESHESAIIVLNRLIGRDSIIRDALDKQNFAHYIQRQV